ncbi:MAG: carboxypeptidase regulatory-like domain-containing protein [Flavobacteriales bacterium]|nr:carboxypeptidase regulatory-like domain-containing protein [Flavobacteriales bacterium]
MVLPFHARKSLHPKIVKEVLARAIGNDCNDHKANPQDRKRDLFRTGIVTGGPIAGQLSAPRGTVKEVTKEPIVRASVTLLDSLGRIVKETASASDGRYHFEPVEPASYAIRVEQAGYQEFQQIGILVKEKTITFVDPVLKPIGWKPPKTKRRKR